MQYSNPILAILLLIANTACNQKNEPNQATQSDFAQKAVADVVKTEAISISAAQKTLQDSKKIEQTIIDSAAEQRENIEKTEH
jgi:hypothetical protein